MYERNLTLLTDFYELTMMQGYFCNKTNETVIFDVFYRTNPSGSGYAICCGLEQVIDYVKNLTFSDADITYLKGLNMFQDDFLNYLKNFKFSGDIYAIPEGTVVFPMEPLVKVIAPIMEAQLIETAILNLINHQSLIATKASRVCFAAKGEGVMEFGLRRAQGPDAGTLGARAAVIGGCIGTSNVLAAKEFKVPALGTHAHSWIMSFDDELTAFRKYAELYPQNTTLLVDTYDTLRSGVPNAIKVAKVKSKPMLNYEYEDDEVDEEEEEVSEIIEKVDDALDTSGSDAREEEWKDMIGAIDFLKTDKEINNALGQLLPSAYGYGAMATMDLHRMLSDFAVGGSLAPATNVKEKGKWHNIVIPYASETDHIKNGTGYKNNHSGMVGAMERTLDDVTIGWHAALNHQSTTGAEIGRLKGDGLYLGAQVKYAPEAWNGWSTFGIARVGVEDFEMKRNFNFNGYSNKVDSDFTAFSGSLRVGGAYEKEAKAMTFGPFAALDYAFAHHPSIEEDGAGAGRLDVESGTYDSLRTQVGYRMQTAPKILEDRTYWQVNAAIAWNHELLDDAGSISASFRDFGGNSFGCDVDNYGRDSLSLMAGMTFKNPTKLDVTFNLGTDIYRHGGNTLYAKCALEWKF